MRKKTQLMMTVGIPGAGKTTWVKEYGQTKNFMWISPDQYLIERYDYQWTPERASEAWANAYQQYAKALKENLNVVWDATFLRPLDRFAVLHLAIGFSYHTTAVVFNTPLELCLERNRKRERNPVPESKIRQMSRNLILPTREEGFHEVLIY